MKKIETILVVCGALFILSILGYWLYLLHWTIVLVYIGLLMIAFANFINENCG